MSEVVMSPETQEAFVDMLARGLSPQVICSQLEISTHTFFITLRDDPEFAVRVAEARVLQSQNVAAFLYREAVGGNVSAMTQYLKFAPPPEWAATSRNTPGNSDEQTISLEELRRAAERYAEHARRAADADSPTPTLSGECAPPESEALSKVDPPRRRRKSGGRKAV